MEPSLANTWAFETSSNVESVPDTRERPYDCPYCQIKFPRADVREKHIKRFHTTEALKNHGIEKVRPVQYERSKHACDRCRKGKLKCNDQRPCKPCWTRGLPCIISSRKIEPGRTAIREVDALAFADDLNDCSVINISAFPASAESMEPHTSNCLTESTASAFHSNAPDNSEVGLLEELRSVLPGPSAASVQRSASPAGQEQGQTLPSSNFHTSFGHDMGASFGDISTTEWTHGDFQLMDDNWELPLLVGSSPQGACYSRSNKYQRRSKHGFKILVAPRKPFGPSLSRPCLTVGELTMPLKSCRNTFNDDRAALVQQ